MRLDDYVGGRLAYLQRKSFNSSSVSRAALMKPPKFAEVKHGSRVYS